jgi:hypothetical protein
MNRQQKENFISVFEKLSDADQAAVSSFAEFLSSRAKASEPSVDIVQAAPATVPDPEAIPRPDDERVVAAVKRLSSTYFMLDKKKMLGVTSDLLTQHVVQGREAIEVIDELEELFRQHYLQLKQGGDQ